MFSVENSFKEIREAVIGVNDRRAGVGWRERVIYFGDLRVPMGDKECYGWVCRGFSGKADAMPKKTLAVGLCRKVYLNIS